ncbi:hypothetical protein AB0D90_34495, partial [Streptomyces althioticus]|uniref:hypothetical protein n=1 Tax=Streptomyces althioticus TaxID=83380 RepID=UPI0033E04E58
VNVPLVVGEIVMGHTLATLQCDDHFDHDAYPFLVDKVQFVGPISLAGGCCARRDWLGARHR